MVFSQLQLAYLYYLELSLIVLQNHSLCESLIKSFEAKQQKQQQQDKNRKINNPKTVIDIFFGYVKILVPHPFPPNRV